MEKDCDCVRQRTEPGMAFAYAVLVLVVIDQVEPDLLADIPPQQKPTFYIY